MRDSLTISLSPLKRLVEKIIPRPELVVQQRVLERIIVADQYPSQDIPVIAFEQAYLTHSWIFTCVRVIATNGAQVPFSVYSEDRGIKVRIANNPISILLNAPNPESPSFALKNQTFGWLELTGNAYWYLAKDRDGIARAIACLRPDRVRINVDDQGIIESYDVTIGAGRDNVPAADMIHFKWFNAYNEHYGQATLQPARDTLVDDTYAKKFNTAFFKHGARPGGVVSFPAELGDEQFKRVKDEIRQGYEGAERAHRILVIDSGAKWEAQGITQKDMDFITARKLNRAEIGSVFGVPPVMMNDYEQANYNTAKVQRRHFWQETMMPKLVYMRELLTLNLWKFGIKAPSLYVDFDQATVPALQEAEMEKQRSYREDISTGLRSINEVRSLMNLGPVEWGDEHLVQAGMISAVTAIESPPNPFASAAPPQKQARKKYSPDEIAAEWKAFVSETDHYEPLFRRAVVPIFEAQQSQVLRALDAEKSALGYSGKTLTDIDIETILFDLEKAKSSVEEAIRPTHQLLIEAGARRGIYLAGLDSAFDMTNPHAELVLMRRSQRFAKHINETTWERLRTALTEALHHGATIQDLQQVVRDKMTLRAGQDSYTIARTEVVGALNEGTIEAWKQSGGAVTGKKWLTAGDEHVRPTHVDAGELEAIPLDDKFPVGGAMMEGPGDPSAPVGEIANCRCSVLPELAETR